MSKVKSVIFTSILAIVVLSFSGCANLKIFSKKNTKTTLSTIENQLVPNPSANATQKEIKEFFVYIRSYELIPPYVQNVFFVKEKAKNQIPIKNSELINLKEEIAEKCKKSKTKKSIAFARLRSSYLLGDSDSITITIKPESLFFSNTKKYLPKPIVLKKGEDKLIKIPPGFFYIEATAKYKSTARRVCVALEDDDFQCYFMTSSSSDKIKAVDVTNTITIDNADGFVYVMSKELNKTFELSSELLIKSPKDKDAKPKLTAMEKALIAKYPKLKDFYESDLTKDGKKTIRIISSSEGKKTVTLPAPILLRLPAGKYKLNSKDVTVECDKLSIIDL